MMKESYNENMTERMGDFISFWTKQWKMQQLCTELDVDIFGEILDLDEKECGEI